MIKSALRDKLRTSHIVRNWSSGIQVCLLAWLFALRQDLRYPGWIQTPYVAEKGLELLIQGLRVSQRSTLQIELQP